MPLKINLDDLCPDEEEPFSGGEVRVGSLLVSSNGLSASADGPSYLLSPADLVMLPEREGGFLGKGSSGAVWQAVNRRTGTRVAVKEIKVTSQAHLTEIRRELETLYDSTAQASPHMVDFYGAYTYEGSVFIVVECMDGTLADLAAPLPLDVLAHVTRSVLCGLVYLHRQRHFIHRDLKPSNVLFKRATGVVKISDFGVSSNLEGTKGDAHSFVGTVTYMSPERLRGDVYSFAADIWSLGLVVAELALGTCPYRGLRDESVEARFWSLLQHLTGPAPALELPEGMDPQLADFISKCVAKEPEERPSCTSLLSHPFITEWCGKGGNEANSEDADQADRDAMRSWLDRLVDKAQRKGCHSHPSPHSEPPQGQTPHSSCAIHYPDVTHGGRCDGLLAGQVGCDGAFGLPEHVVLGHESSSGTGFCHARVEGATRTPPRQGAAAVSRAEANTRTSSSERNSNQNRATGGEYPALLLHRQVDDEPSVNLDEELDKLLL